ncbi:hypothetical protein TWF718_002585 [Orbilia javanica]|uniref:Uncharacterized protein n=1 Tax=Orbilia javanica TaxID=47235 RepID=A0AAN8MKC0_9PEZI
MRLLAAVPYILLLLLFGTQESSLVAGQPTPTATVPPALVTTRTHVVERLNVRTNRNINDVKQRLQRQLGNITSPALLSAAADSRANYTAAVNRYMGPSGYIWFQTILHGRWFRLWGFADTTAYVPKDMTQYTIGNPLDLLVTARYTLDAFLDAPLRLLLIDTADGGTEIMWERPYIDAGQSNCLWAMSPRPRATVHRHQHHRYQQWQNQAPHHWGGYVAADKCWWRWRWLWILGVLAGPGDGDGDSDSDDKEEDEDDEEESMALE